MKDIIHHHASVVDAMEAGERIVLARELEAELGRNNLYYLCRYILQYEDMRDFHKKLGRFYDDNRHYAQFHLHPRGHFKTTMLTIGGKAQLILRQPDITILLLANTVENAETILTSMRMHFIANDKFRALYPNHVPHRRSQEGTNSKFTTPARTKPWIRQATIETAGIDRALVSRHFDHIHYDDVVDDKNTTTPELRLKNWQAYNTSLSLVDGKDPNGNPWVHIVGTRWHMDDTYSRLLALQREREIFRPLITSAYRKVPTKSGGTEMQYLFPERFTPEYLEHIRASQGSAIFNCTPGFATIWMADGTFKPISEVRVGDKVMGFKRGGKNTTLRPTAVKKVQSRVAPVVQEMALANGDKVYCTPGHKWYTGRLDNTHRLYKPASIGSVLVKAIDPVTRDNDPQKVRDWGWLAGMLDGEGGLTGRIVTISQSEKHNKPVIEKLRRVLERLNIEYTEHSNKVNDCICFNFRGGRQMKTRLLVNMDFGKGYQLANQVTRLGFKLSKGEPRTINGIRSTKILSIREWDTDIPVYALQTESGNYISQGYASKNCLYLNDPVPDEDAVLSPSFFKFYNDAEIKSKPLNTVMTVDPAPSNDKSKDPSVISVFSMDSKSNIYVRKIMRGWWLPEELVRNIVDMAQIYRINEVGIEAVAFSLWLCHYVEKERNDRRLFFQITPVKRNSHKSKEDRQRRIIPFHRNGKIFYHEDEPEMAIVTKEHREYPKGRYDDYLDTLTDGIEMLGPAYEHRNQPQYYRRPPVVRHRRNKFQTGISTRTR